jgi:hypothetical protein
VEVLPVLNQAEGRTPTLAAGGDEAEERFARGDVLRPLNEGGQLGVLLGRLADGGMIDVEPS